MNKLLLSAPLVAVLLAGGLVVGTSANASSPQPPSRASAFTLDRYSAAAANLPPAMIAAITRDLRLSGAQFLADGAAAADAVALVGTLEKSGVAVQGSRIDGATVTVYVKNEADAARVTASGAVAAIGTPPKPVLPAAPLRPVAGTLYDGTGVYWQTSSTSGRQCSVGFNGFAISSGANQLVTAGHCAAAMTSSTPVYALVQNAPQAGGSRGSLIGSVVSGSARFGNGQDAGLVSVTGMTPVPAVATWNGGQGAPLASAPQAVTGVSSAIVNAKICKSGSRSGWTCGTVTSVDTTVNVQDGSTVYQVNSIVANICLVPGDSGGSALMGSNAVGISSASSSSSFPCASNAIGTFFEMLSARGLPDVASAFAGTWEPSVTVAAPVVTASTNGTTATPGTLSGTLTNASASSTVRLYVDGSTTAAATASASSGRWSLTFPSLSAGTHSYKVIASWGVWSRSAPTSGSVTVAQASSAQSTQPSKTLLSPTPSLTPVPTTSSSPSTVGKTSQSLIGSLLGR
ncbi:S1 family peptidase [Frigoribacterium sp. CG_9.8]|uniref:S1 family peptidase n=1 Tax=Frigoribacterium sp. CG_9.8 TaxID=2787733 RepID=UPI0018CA817D|nr:S1 family peptidase [Frigoribacterium sp. CG_9.8]MBG6106435.1 hypothetical protein [Frigoribacterium sp. CG_9.8]